MKGRVNAIEVGGRKYRVELRGDVARPVPRNLVVICEDGHHKIFNHDDEAQYKDGRVVCCSSGCGGRRYKVIPMKLEAPKRERVAASPSPTIKAGEYASGKHWSRRASRNGQE